MYNPGGEYLSYIKDSTIRKPRSKIVVDGKIYTGLEHLVSFPKITHETEKMIGGFPAKTCEFEIYNLDGSLNLNGKEVQVYRGLDISDTRTVWVPMGLFYADGEDVTNNSTKRTIQFKGTDRTRLFDTPFENVYSNGIIPAETVVSTVVEKICLKHGLSVDTATKANIISYRFTEAVGTPESTTDRQTISWIAELSGCIPIISRDGQSLVFTRPTYKGTVTEAGKTYPSGAYADKSKYKTLSAEPLYGPVNAVSFGHADYDDSYVYQDDADVQANGLHEWQINDNPLVENDRTGIAPKVFAKIKGMKLYPFNLTDFIDDYLFDINDGIQIKKKDGTHIMSYVLGVSTTSRIRSTFKAGTQDSSAADRNLAGSVKADLKSVKLSVDHVNNQITALVKESDDKYSEFTQTINGIKGEIVDTKNDLEAEITATASAATSQYTALKTEVEKNYVANSTYNTFVNQTAEKFSTQAESIKNIQDEGYITEERCNSLIEAQSDKITLSVEENLKIGTRNILLNSECFAGFTPTKYKVDKALIYPSYPDTYVPSGKYSQVIFTADSTGGDTGITRGIRFVESDILGQSTVDKVKPNTTYTLSFWLKTDSAFSHPGNLVASSAIYAGEGVKVTLDTNRSTAPTLTTSWQKYVLTFKITGSISNFYIMLFFTDCLASTQYRVDFSSFKLEEGNIATDWTPSAEDTEKSVQAKIDMCVKMDENGNLESEINISGDKLTIDTQNFTLAKDGTITCQGATIEGNITATSGSIGGWNIGNGCLSCGYGSNSALFRAPTEDKKYFISVGGEYNNKNYDVTFALLEHGEIITPEISAVTNNLKISTATSVTNRRTNFMLNGQEIEIRGSTAYRDCIWATGGFVLSAGSNSSGNLCSLSLLGSPINLISSNVYADGNVYVYSKLNADSITMRNYMDKSASNTAFKPVIFYLKTGEFGIGE